MTEFIGARRVTIRSKVTAALLLVALVPMIVVGVVAFQSARDSARRQAIDRLAGIAAVQEARVNAYALSSLENLALVASRTQLRRSFAAQMEEPADENLELMQRILGDAVASSATAKRIELVDPDGRVVSSSDGTELDADRSDVPAFVFGLEGPDLSHITERGGERVAIHGRPVSLDDRELGVVLIEASLDPLDRLMTDYTGLGESGETILASAFDLDSVELLGDVRFPEELGNETVIDGDLLNRALGGIEGDVVDQRDYRGNEVLAVARSVDAVPGWALTVKVDEAEALADANRLRNLLTAALGLATLVVLAAASLLARALTRPIVELHDAAVAVAGGDTDRRAKVMSNDELAGLALQFNRMTDELTEANARLRLTNEQLEEFVYISSHDLKSPLRSISSFGQLLQTQYDDVFDDEGREYIGFIRDGTARMHAVIDDLLEYLRIEKVGHVVEMVELDRTFDDIFDLHRPDLDECQADIRRGPLPIIEGSAALLRQLFDNVVQNAIRYRKPDRPLILEITASQHRDTWQIAIADNGHGVPEDRRQEAFTVFKRLSETGKGNGMGLAICRRIARRHGGDVSMADSPHGGVSIVITLTTGSTVETSASDGEKVLSAPS
ncbi:MAG: ATP-binding protein [Acidimicrobiales bacterium]